MTDFDLVSGSERRNIIWKLSAQVSVAIDLQFLDRTSADFVEQLFTAAKVIEMLLSLTLTHLSLRLGMQ